MKMLVINDPHVASTPPRGCRPVYTDDIFNMLEECRDIVRERDVEMTVFTGDLFNSKQNTSHGVVRRFVELLREWPGEKIAIVGNHDLGAAGLDSVKNQPIGVLFEAGVLFWLDHDLGFNTSDGLKLYMSPANYTDDIDDDPANFAVPEIYFAVDWRIKVAHGSIVKPGKQYPDAFKVVPMDTIPVETTDAVLFGHIHNDQGITVVNDCLFVGTGSLGRVARADYNYMKKMRVALLTITKDEITPEFVQLTRFVPPEELFYAKADTGVEMDTAMTRFTKNIMKNLSVEGSSVEEALSALGESFDPEVAAAVKKHLGDAGWE